ncbi:MAG: RNB domain-containing ribonuclease [Propionibacteriaceae bacterium]
MPSPRIQVSDTIPAPIAAGIARLRSELEIPAEHSEQALAQAHQVALAAPVIGVDMTSIPFITIDPAGARDLDQAMFIERSGDGYIVRYAIANVAAWVTPGSVLDQEVHQRGCTYYAPSNNVPLHPVELAHQAASLLADEIARPAYVWTLQVAADGEVTTATVERAMVKSIAQRTYRDCQDDLDAGTASEIIKLLAEVGIRREKLEMLRGGISLPIPEQEIIEKDGSWALEYRSSLPVEGWNAQISLMTGMAAAQMMMAAKVGVLRTLPAADDASLGRLRGAAKALRISWPQDMDYATFVRSLDPEKSQHLTMLNQCAQLFRGARYQSFDGELPAEDCQHHALAAYYAHTTAPLRRLVDRYVLEICAALCAKEPIPQWCLSALATLPQEMEVCDKRAKKYERGVVNLVEAMVMSSRVGQQFRGTCLDGTRHGEEGVVLLDDPAIEGTCRGKIAFGAEVEVTLVAVDVAQGTVLFESVNSHSSGQPSPRRCSHRKQSQPSSGEDLLPGKPLQR